MLHGIMKEIDKFFKFSIIIIIIFVPFGIWKLLELLFGFYNYVIK
jgi:hypothetical protein